jgi:iron complex transport system permease protein
MILICAVLGALLLIAVIISAAHGPVAIPYADAIRLTLRGLGMHIGLDLPDSQYAIITQVRIPRILVAMLVGAALAASGATLQGVFRNPLADPAIIGVSVGGSLGAVIAITLGLIGQSLWFMPLFAFVGSMLAAMGVYGLSLSQGRSQPATLILAGVAINALLGALISALLLFANRFIEVQAILSWLIGGLRARSWPHLAVIALPIPIALGLMLAHAREINLLLMGEETAQGLGVDVPRTRLILLAVAALATGSAVSVAGPIGFVGLVVPHILRLIIGPDYRVLLPASILGGALFLVLADTLARLILDPVELQVGIVTALLGAPFFIFLLIRNRSLMRSF